jgi:2-C-methyl-D-erythritol 4-phosphate cytidylyltransferase
MEKFVLIVAGGKGSRMLSEIPKQFLNLNGIPLLMHTISRFTAFSDIEVLLVLPENQMILWSELCARYSFDSPQTIKGGDSRFQSVKNGLNAIGESEGIVAIHDGVRPFISKSLIVKNFSEAQKQGSALTVVELKESLRQLIGANSFSLNRADFRLVQTPQTFSLKKIRKAYDVNFKEEFTDDASVFESDGNEIHLVDGDYSNIKVTTPEDLVIAESLMKSFKYNV